MLTNQMIKLIKLCETYQIKISYNEIVKVCSIDSNIFDIILQYFSKCPKENRTFFLEVLLCDEFIEYYAFLKILKLISKLNSEYLEDLKEILIKEDITKMPSLMKYLNVFYVIANNKLAYLKPEQYEKIIEILPEASDAYTNSELMEFLLERLEGVYNYYVIDADILYLEDGGEDLLRAIDKHYRLRSKNREYKTGSLTRSLKKKELLKEPGKIIEVDFTKGQK